MNYNNGFQFLAGAFAFFSLAVWFTVLVAISDAHVSKKWLFLPATTTVLTLIFGFLAVIGSGKP